MPFISAVNTSDPTDTENRVRIVEADDAQISSAVIGNSGLYEQTIRLKDGHLISKCSCALPEEPMCRHCIAVFQSVADTNAFHIGRQYWNTTVGSSLGNRKKQAQPERLKLRRNLILRRMERLQHRTSPRPT
jgi:uncharacterized Zn finger protein